jgi:hypothetical protein
VAVSMKNMVFQVITPYTVRIEFDRSEEHIASIFRVKE